MNSKATTTKKRTFQIIDCQKQRNASSMPATKSTTLVHKRSKHEKAFLPAYATHDEAYFGKWQPTMCKKQQHGTDIPSPPTSITGATPPPDILTKSSHSTPPLTLHSSRCWGSKLPPLKAIMDDHIGLLIHDRTLPPPPLIPFAHQRSMPSHSLV